MTAWWRIYKYTAKIALSKGEKKMNSAEEFLIRHKMNPELICPARCAEQMKDNMIAGLNGNVVDMPMIPAYLSNEGTVPEGVPAIVIDAGGTNYRCALAVFRDGKCETEKLKVCAMPGTEKPCSWDELISFVADSIEPLAQYSDVVGFCFSYNAQITPDMDGCVHKVDKEVVIEGSEGQLIGSSLKAELERRGISGKRVIILNDTVAVLLGGAASLDKSRYSGFAGQVSGTGTNTCCSVDVKSIGKLSLPKTGSMLINLESGMYDGIPCGDFDRLLDKQSHNPGEKIFEKITAGVYLGELGRLILNGAGECGLISKESKDALSKLDAIDASYIDSWSRGLDPYSVFSDDKDLSFAETVSYNLIERSARCMCTNILAIMLLTNKGRESTKPVCVCAEGSLVQKSFHYLPLLRKLLKEYGEELMNRYAVVRVCEGTTMSGSAAAAILNA